VKVNLLPLENAWFDLLAPFGADPRFVGQTWQQIVIAYSGAGRFYHTLEHVADVLATIGRLSDTAEDLATTLLAAWLHDVVYDTRASDNEERSAAFADGELPVLRAPPDRIAHVRGLILATKTHRGEEADWDTRILLDADLAVLGSPPADYAAYADAIRREYAWVPEPQFRAGRRAVLETFLERPRIYWTDLLFTEREARARENLRDEVQRLKL
jgi:predicted metal-dependent HD superfamily phosphohydrolase